MPGYYVVQCQVLREASDLRIMSLKAMLSIQYKLTKSML